MSQDPHFWNYVDERSGFKEPSEVVVQAVAVLVSVAPSVQAPNPKGSLTFWLYDRLVPTALKDILMSRTAFPDGDVLLNSEEDPMGAVEDYQLQQQRRLELIVNNPEAASRTFPDPDQRNNVLSLMKRLHKMELDLTRDNSSVK